MPFKSLVAAPWKNGGGVTRQITCLPSGSGLDDFDWRLSTAEVAQDGAFSRFEGIDRRLCILEGSGLELRFEDGKQRVQKGGHIDFAGEAAVFGALIDGPVTDLNIMVRRGRVRMRAGQMSIDGVTEIDHGWGPAALFVLSGEITAMDAVARRFDTMVLDGAETLRLSGAGELLLIGFETL